MIKLLSDSNFRVWFLLFFGWSRLIKAEATNKSARKAKKIISPVINPKEQVVRCRDGATEEANRKNDTGEEKCPTCGLVVLTF